MKPHWIFSLLLALPPLLANGQGLDIVEQDYPAALAKAAESDKLVFVDFYTSWCAPCKELDKLIFQNDSVRDVLGKDFVLLRYDAENDTTFHLSKKHHVSSYPTGLILNPEGYLVARKYGFPGDDFEALSQSVLVFTEQALRRSQGDTVIAGYSNHIDGTEYPGFYIDYVNRTNTKVDSTAFREYWDTERNVFSEGYFSTLFYFASEDIPDRVADRLLEHKEIYSTLYGSTDVDIALMFLSFNKLGAAVADGDREQLAVAAEYTRAALDKDFAEEVVARYEEQFRAAVAE
ncbi:thioredoxin-like protein [Neolewinella xylanilytica]|uniref:Thioredoxin-like protein n=1 Tax=Neolewinella xylanilytica TaxID=1514080 RepID=A0A2S6I794_9BACT|nr:thioredoxin family protein [Neolewinella xylanilytica]PPK87381.1 thioredoxin-like protein [Neolewinella xylanilytica]